MRTKRTTDLAIGLIVSVSLGVGAAHARDCRDETPLPADVKLVAPGSDVPATAARFSGAWIGAWKEESGDTVCATLMYCRTWNVGDRGRQRCYRLYRDGETFELHAIDRWGVTKLRRIN